MFDFWLILPFRVCILHSDTSFYCYCICKNYIVRSLIGITSGWMFSKKRKCSEKSNIYFSDIWSAIPILFSLFRSLSASSRHSRIKDPELSDKNSQYLVGQGNWSRTCTPQPQLWFTTHSHQENHFFNETGLLTVISTFLFFPFPRLSLSFPHRGQGVYRPFHLWGP